MAEKPKNITHTVATCTHLRLDISKKQAHSTGLCLNNYVKTHFYFSAVAS